MTAGQDVDCLPGNITVGTVDSDDLWRLIGNVTESSLGNGKFYVHPFVKQALLNRLMASGGGNAIVDLSAGVTKAKMFGYEICTSTALPKDPAAGEGFMVFGDLRKGARFYDRRSIEVKTFDQTFSSTDEVFLRATARLSAAVIQPGALAVLKLAAS